MVSFVGACHSDSLTTKIFGFNLTSTTDPRGRLLEKRSKRKEPLGCYRGESLFRLMLPTLYTETRFRDSSMAQLYCSPVKIVVKEVKEKLRKGQRKVKNSPKVPVLSVRKPPYLFAIWLRRPVLNGMGVHHYLQHG